MRAFRSLVRLQTSRAFFVPEWNQTFLSSVSVSLPPGKRIIYHTESRRRGLAVLPLFGSNSTPWASYNVMKRFYSFSGAPKDPSKQSMSFDEKRYSQIADETLDSLVALFEEIGDLQKNLPDFDASYSNGVLTVQLRPGETYVINKQTPNRQIWLSSPHSGPKRYDFVNGTWIYVHSGESLHGLLTDEVSKILERPVDFSQCLFGKASETA